MKLIYEELSIGKWFYWGHFLCCSFKCTYTNCLLSN